MTPFPGASEPKPTFQELGTPWASVQYFKFIRGSGAPRVPRAAARRALLLLLLLLLLALLPLAARCCSPCARARPPACRPAGPPACPPPARRRPAARISSSASTSTRSATKNKSTRLPRSLLWVLWAGPRASGWLWWVPGPFAHPGGPHQVAIMRRRACGRCAEPMISSAKRSQKQMAMSTVLASEGFMT